MSVLQKEQKTNPGQSSTTTSNGKSSIGQAHCRTTTSKEKGNFKDGSDNGTISGSRGKETMKRNGNIKPGGHGSNTGGDQGNEKEKPNIASN